MKKIRTYSLKSNAIGLALALASSLSAVAAPKLNSNEVRQVRNQITSALQVPDAQTYINGGGALVEVLQTTVSPKGDYVHTTYAAFPTVAGSALAETFSNNNGVLTSVAQVLPDTNPASIFFPTGSQGVDAGQASNDFSLVSLLDDAGSASSLAAPNTYLRLQVFNNPSLSLLYTNQTSLTSTTISDFVEGSGSGNGGVFSQDNKYLFFCYTSTTKGAIINAVSVQAGLPIVASAPIGTGAAFGENVQYIRTKDGSEYIILAFGTFPSFTTAISEPPFHFAVYKFDRRTLSLTQVALSPLMSTVPLSNNATLLSDGYTIRIAATQSDNSVPAAAIADIFAPITPPSGALDLNSFQIFDFNSKKGELKKVWSENINGQGFAQWVPTSDGTALAVSVEVSNTLNPNTFSTDTGYTAITWLMLEEDNERRICDSRQIGRVNFIGNETFALGFDADAKWLVASSLLITPLGSEFFPNFGFPSTEGCFGNGAGCTPLINPPWPASTFIPQTGWNSLILYSLDFETRKSGPYVEKR